MTKEPVRKELAYYADKIFLFSKSMGMLAFALILWLLLGKLLGVI